MTGGAASFRLGRNYSLFSDMGSAFLGTKPPVMGKDGSTVRYVGTVRYASIFAKRYGTLVRYAFFVMVRVRYVGTVRLFVMVRVWYVGTMFELKIPHFSYIAPDFCMQRQKTAKSDAKCVN